MKNARRTYTDFNEFVNNEPETEIEVPKQGEEYFEKEQEEYQEYLRLKTKFEK